MANTSDALARKVEEAVRAYDTLSQTRAKVAALVRAEVEAARADKRDAMAYALESRDLICEALQRELGPERTMRALGLDPARVAQSRREIAEGKTVSLDELTAAIRARGGAKEKNDAE